MAETLDETERDSRVSTTPGRVAAWPCRQSQQSGPSSGTIRTSPVRPSQLKQAPVVGRFGRLDPLDSAAAGLSASVSAAAALIESLLDGGWKFTSVLFK